MKLCDRCKPSIVSEEIYYGCDECSVTHQYEKKPMNKKIKEELEILNKLYQKNRKLLEQQKEETVGQVRWTLFRSGYSPLHISQLKKIMDVSDENELIRKAETNYYESWLELGKIYTEVHKKILSI